MNLFRALASQKHGLGGLARELQLQSYFTSYGAISPATELFHQLQSYFPRLESFFSRQLVLSVRELFFLARELFSRFESDFLGKNAIFLC